MKKRRKIKKVKKTNKYTTKNILESQIEDSIQENDDNEEKELIELESSIKLPTPQFTSTDAIKQYIKKISQINTDISREEIHKLWKRVKSGDRRAKEKTQTYRGAARSVNWNSSWRCSSGNSKQRKNLQIENRTIRKA